MGRIKKKKKKKTSYKRSQSIANVTSLIVPTNRSTNNLYIYNIYIYVNKQREVSG